MTGPAAHKLPSAIPRRAVPVQIAFGPGTPLARCDAMTVAPLFAPVCHRAQPPPRQRKAPARAISPGYSPCCSRASCRSRRCWRKAPHRRPAGAAARAGLWPAISAASPAPGRQHSSRRPLFGGVGPAAHPRCRPTSPAAPTRRRSQPLSPGQRPAAAAIVDPDALPAGAAARPGPRPRRAEPAEPAPVSRPAIWRAAAPPLAAVAPLGAAADARVLRGSRRWRRSARTAGSADARPPACRGPRTGARSGRPIAGRAARARRSRRRRRSAATPEPGARSAARLDPRSAGFGRRLTSRRRRSSLARAGQRRCERRW